MRSRYESDCPLEEMICGYVDKTLDGKGREEIEQHLAICDSCLGKVADLIREIPLLKGAELLDVDESALRRTKGLVDRPAPSGRKFLVSIGGKIRSLFPARLPEFVFNYRFATVTLTVFLLVIASVYIYDRQLKPGDSYVPQLRGPDEELPELITPIGEIESRESIAFQWEAMADVDSYEVIIFDMASGTTLMKSTTTSPSFELRENIDELSTGVMYYWLVKYYYQDGRVETAKASEFQIIE